MPKKKREKTECRLELTSLMDIVFLLIIFFLLVINFQAQEVPELDIPHPDQSQSYTLEKERVIINVMPSDDDAKGSVAKEIVVSGHQPIVAGDEGKLTNILDEVVKAHGGDPENIEVDLRAGAGIAYEFIAPVIKAINQARIARINMVAINDE